MGENNGSNLQAGDHIIVYRESSGAFHHGIYVGENKEGVKSVIHFICSDEKTRLSTTSEKIVCETCEYTKNVQNGGVAKTCLKCLISDCSMKVKEYSDGTFKPSDQVVYTAYDLFQNGFGKNGENCEDFAIFCKTGNINSRSKMEEVHVSATTITVLGGLFKFERFKSFSKRRII